MNKKKNLIGLFMLVIFFLFSACEKEEHISYSIVMNNQIAGPDYIEIEFTVFAPGKVNIEEYGIEYRETSSIPVIRVPYNDIRHPGTYRIRLEGLNPATNYEFWIYSESDGYKYQTQPKTFTTNTIFMP